MFGKYDQNHKLIPAAMELVRLAIPRRVYTQSHLDYVAEVIIYVYQNRKKYHGFAITEEAPLLRHFTAKLKPVDELITLQKNGGCNPQLGNKTSIFN